MKDIEKEARYRRLAVWHKFCNHNFRYWLYNKLAEYYDNKHLKHFINK